MTVCNTNTACFHMCANGVTLSFERMHPIISAYRPCLTTLGQAIDWYENR